MFKPGNASVHMQHGKSTFESSAIRESGYPIQTWNMCLFFSTTSFSNYKYISTLPFDNW